MLSLFAELQGLMKNNVRRISGSGAPVDGTSGTGVNDCGPGSEYTDYVTGLRYINLGTKTSPVWSAGSSLSTERVSVQDFTIAQVNAGATVLAAIAGFKYQLVDGFIVAIGGAAGAVTTVDILGVQATVSSKLVAFAQAGLTQSAVLKMGGTSAAVLADGASFAKNDANTAITINKTGSNVTTATSFRLILRYLLTT